MPTEHLSEQCEPCGLTVTAADTPFARILMQTFKDEHATHQKGKARR